MQTVNDSYDFVKAVEICDNRVYQVLFRNRSEKHYKLTIHLSVINHLYLSTLDVTNTIFMNILMIDVKLKERIIQLQSFSIQSLYP